MNNIKKHKTQKLLSLLVLLVGIILLVFMIITEDEPGAIPLLLVIFGAGWYLFTRSKLRSLSSNS